MKSVGLKVALIVLNKKKRNCRLNLKICQIRMQRKICKEIDLVQVFKSCMNT